MDRSKIIKYTGFVFGSFIVITVIVFFLYPYLNEKKYGEIVESSEPEITSKESTDDLRLGGEFEYLSERISFYKKEQTRLLAIIDSLKNNNEEIKREYEKQIADLLEQNAEMETAVAQTPIQQTPVQQQQQQPQPATPQPAQAQFVANTGNNMANPGNMGMEMNQEEQEEFFDRVKSFLNLDEEELAPIVSKLDNEELVRLYRGGGTIQREKLLRSLKPDRAAEIMKEIML